MKKVDRRGKNKHNKKHKIPTYAVPEQDIMTVKKVDKVPVREKGDRPEIRQKKA